MSTIKRYCLLRNFLKPEGCEARRFFGSFRKRWVIHHQAWHEDWHSDTTMLDPPWQRGKTPSSRPQKQVWQCEVQSRQQVWFALIWAAVMKWNISQYKLRDRCCLGRSAPWCSFSTFLILSFSFLYFSFSTAIVLQVENLILITFSSLFLTNQCPNLYFWPCWLGKFSLMWYYW